MEAKPKGNDEYCQDYSKLCHSVDDLVEHKDEEAEVGDVAEVGEEVEPGRGHQQGANWPLPALQKQFLKSYLKFLVFTFSPLQPKVSHGMQMSRTKTMDKV